MDDHSLFQIITKHEGIRPLWSLPYVLQPLNDSGDRTPVLYFSQEKYGCWWHQWWQDFPTSAPTSGVWAIEKLITLVSVLTFWIIGGAVKDSVFHNTGTWHWGDAACWSRIYLRGWTEALVVLNPTQRWQWIFHNCYWSKDTACPDVRTTPGIWCAKMPATAVLSLKSLTCAVTCYCPAELTEQNEICKNPKRSSPLLLLANITVGSV